MQYSSKDKIDKSYDVIVVGGGLAGLTLANKMGKMAAQYYSSKPIIS